MTEGLPRIYVPVCKHPKHYQRTTGPLGWVEVKELGDCPLLVEPLPAKRIRPRQPQNRQDVNRHLGRGPRRKQEKR